MTAKEFPKKIWLQKEDDEHPECSTYYGEGMTWCEDKINNEDVEYIRADLVNQKALHIAEQACEIEADPERRYESEREWWERQEICNRILSRIKELTEEK